MVGQDVLERLRQLGVEVVDWACKVAADFQNSYLKTERGREYGVECSRCAVTLMSVERQMKRGAGTATVVMAKILLDFVLGHSCAVVIIGQRHWAGSPTDSWMTTSDP